MNGSFLLLFAILIFAAAYRIYGRFLSKKLHIDNSVPTPSHTLKDNIDFSPAKTPVLFGHHFASIAGVGPIVGPVLGLAFGWVPVYLWILIGAIFIGGVHDYTTLVASIRHQGKTIGNLIENYLGISGKKLFLLFTWAALILVIAVFAIVVSDTFVSIPSVGTSSILFIFIAVIFGFTMRKYKFSLLPASILGVIVLFAALYFGQLIPLTLSKITWQLIIFGYIFIASVVPVWILLQPRDYLNSFFLYALLLGGIAGLFFLSPEIKADGFTSISVDKLGYIFPALFVTVACGAISGFHSIVSSGTTSKQLNIENDAQKIGYGGMLLEGILAILALISVSLFTQTEYLEILKKEGPVTAFSSGIAEFINSIPFLNISVESARSFVALAVAAFALTTLDTATRLARYSFQEYFELSGSKRTNNLLTNRFFATGITVLLGLSLAFSGQTMSIWPIFGSSNQLLAALALLSITVWMAYLKEKYLFSLLPMLFMFAVTLTALAFNFYTNTFQYSNYLLGGISLILLLLALSLGTKAYKFLTNRNNTN